MLCNKCNSRIAVVDTAEGRLCEVCSGYSPEVRRDVLPRPSFVKQWNSSAVFRWFVCQIPLLVFGVLLKEGTFSSAHYVSGGYLYFEYGVGYVKLQGYATPIWVLILTVPAVWVWRKPLFSWLNKKAEEDYS